MAHQLSLNADTGGTSTLPKSSLAIKEELMQNKGLFLDKAIDPTVTRKRSSIDHAKPSAKKRESSKSKSVPTGSKKLILDRPGRSAMKKLPELPV